MNPIRLNFLPISFGISLFALFFCVWNILSFTEDFCFSTTSCQLFAEFAIMGISFWWFGAFFFTVTLFLALFGLIYFGKLFTGFGVFIDFILLCIMFYTMPCLNCLVIGFCVAGTYYAFCFEGQRKGMPWPRPLILFPWGIVYIMIVGNIFMSYAKPWALVVGEDVSIHAYFSTSCSACASLITSDGDRKDISWYPVQESDEDVWKVKRLQEELAKGIPFKVAYQNILLSQLDTDIRDIFSLSHWVLQFNLWKNAGYVAKSGGQVLPLVEFHGTPSQSDASRANSTGISNSGVILLDGGQSSSLNNNSQSTTQSTESILGIVTSKCGDEIEPCPE